MSKVVPSEQTASERTAPETTASEPAARDRYVLFVAYYFPPSGGPGVQRTLKFTRYLPEFGFTPLVLTVPEDAEFPARDESLLEECPPADHVFRSPIREFYHAYRFLTGGSRGSDAAADIRSASRTSSGPGHRVAHAIRGAFFIPDGRMGWFPSAVRTGARILRRYPVQAIVATGPPFTAHWIGQRLSERSGVPLVLDFRDPWTRAPFYPKRPRWARWLDERLERRCVRTARAVVTVNRAIRDDFRKRIPDVPASRYHLIRNAYDDADFEGRSRRPGDRWTLTYTGSILAAHIPHVLLQVLREWVQESPDMREEIRLRLAGRRDPEMERLLAAPPFDELTRYAGYLPHGDSVQELFNAHLLLLLIVKDKQAHGMVTGKLFEYLGSGTPILAIAPEGEAAEILRDAGGSRVVAPDDATGLRRALEEAYQAYRNGTPAFGAVEMTKRRRYTRREATRKLAALIETFSVPQTTAAGVAPPTVESDDPSREEPA